MAIRTEIMPAGNSRFAKAVVSCFYDSEVQNSSFVHLMKLSAKNPHHLKAAERWQKIYDQRCPKKHLKNFDLFKKKEETVIYLTRK